MISLPLKRSRKNIVASDFTGANWGVTDNAVTGAYITHNTTTTPSGANAHSLTESSVYATPGNRHGIYYIINTTSGTYTTRIVAKQRSGTRRLRVCPGGADANDYAAVTFNLDTGAIVQSYVNGNFSSVAGKMRPLSNGWFECIVTHTATVGYMYMVPCLSQSDSAGYLSSGWAGYSTAADNASGVYVGEAKIVKGAYL